MTACRGEGMGMDFDVEPAPAPHLFAAADAIAKYGLYAALVIGIAAVIGYLLYHHFKSRITKKLEA